MPDPEMHDPLDDAYLRAEALLGGDRERAGRRERVLAAVEAETTAAASQSAKSRRGLHPGWMRRRRSGC